MHEMSYTNQYKFLIKATLVTGCFFINSCENSLDQIKELTEKKIGVEEAKQVDIIYSYGSKTKARLSAPYMLIHQDAVPFIEFTKTVHSDFYDDSLQIESRLDARYGRYMQSESKVFLKDSVVVFNVKGDTLYCDELYWDRAKKGQEFFTDKAVRIRTPSQIIDGDGLDAPQDFKSWHIINGRGKVRVSSEEFPE